jgi:transposase
MEALRKEEPRLIFIDESSINTDMIRRYGRAPKGERVQGKIPRNTPPAHSIVGALAPEGLIAAMEIEGAIDGSAFAAFIRECLIPELKRDDIVVLDNNSTHLHPQALASMEAAGAWLIFLPAYSPDLNPIEQCWAKVKQILRDAAARTTKALHRAFRHAVAQITPENAKAWFKHIGYWVPSTCIPL